MCGRIAQFGPFREIVDLLTGWPSPYPEPEEAPPRYNLPPTAQARLLNVEGHDLVAQRVRWGWRPHWATDKPAPINARAEKVAHGPFFRAIWPHRALCPIDGWFEWVNEDGPKKQPYFIRRRDGAPSFCASIGQYPGGGHEPSEHDGFVIITADSQGGMVDIHDRRPVVFAPDLAQEWLDPATPKERAEAMILHQGERSEIFEWFPVSKDVGNVRNDRPDLIEPIGHPLV
ncbi:SOS response-associated peptidase [Pseudomonas boanensis]|uniref:SOS response-associated peptidase n=1 Tax=Metapseudomonas boanensis TaxID=2822138 RepID=UPI0035D46262